VAVLAALALPSVAAARTPKAKHHRGHAHARITGTWDVQVTPDGQQPFQVLTTFTRDHSVIETEADIPGTGQGAWKRVGRHRFAFAFQNFLFNETGEPAGHSVVRGVATLSGDTLTAPFKFNIYDQAGNVVASGAGTSTATRFVIPDF
jgi:hypothetical protein